MVKSASLSDRVTENKSQKLFTILNDIHHKTNPLHVYCRLTEYMGKKYKKISLWICKGYEISVFPFIDYPVRLLQVIVKSSRNGRELNPLQ